MDPKQSLHKELLHKTRDLRWLCDKGNPRYIDTTTITFDPVEFWTFLQIPGFYFGDYDEVPNLQQTQENLLEDQLRSSLLR
jgi:hypothetical protein